MLHTILRLEKMAALHQIFAKWGMMVGTTASYMARMPREEEEVPEVSDVEGSHGQDDEDDGGPVDGTLSNSLSDIKLATRICMYLFTINLS